MSSPAIASDGAELGRRFDVQRQAFRRRTPAYRERVDALRRLEKTLLARKAEIIQAIDEDFLSRFAQTLVKKTALREFNQLI